MTDLAAIGEMIGKAMASRGGEAPSVNVHVPSVEVSVDPLPLAQAVQAGHQQNAKALELLGGVLTEAVCKSVIEAVSRIPDADLAGVEVQLSRLAAAVEANASGDLVAAVASLKGALEQNTKMVAELVAAVTEQNRVMMKSKTVSYDAQGRITRVEVG